MHDSKVARSTENHRSITEFSFLTTTSKEARTAKGTITVLKLVDVAGISDLIVSHHDDDDIA
jgi:beta-lactamase superfamily II metal-dependent hydrolase